MEFSQISWSHRMCQPEVHELLWLDREWINPRAVWALHLGFERGSFGRGFSSSTGAKPKGCYRKTKQLLFRATSRLVGVQNSALCSAGRGFPHTGRQILNVKLKETALSWRRRQRQLWWEEIVGRLSVSSRHPSVVFHVWILAHCRRAL